MGRKYVDCRELPSEIGCTVTIAGSEDEVLRMATRHAMEDHGEPDTPELREMIRSSMKDEPALEPSSRTSGQAPTVHGGIH